MLYPNRFIYFEGGPKEPQAPAMSEADVQKLEHNIEDEGGLEDRKEAAEDKYEAFTDAIDDRRDADPELKRLQSSEYRDAKVKELGDLNDAHIADVSQQFGDKAPDVAAFLQVMAGVGSNEDVSHALLARLEGIEGVDVSHDPEDLNEMKEDFIEVAAGKIVEQKVAKVKAEYEAAKNGEDNKIATEVMKGLKMDKNPKKEFDAATKAYDEAVQKLALAKTALEEYKEGYEGWDEALTEQALNNVKARIEGEIADQKGQIGERQQKVIESIDAYLQANVDYGTAFRAKGVAEKNYRTFESVIDDKMDTAVDEIEDSEDKWVQALGKLDNPAIIAIAGQFGDKAADVKKFLQVMVKTGSNEGMSNALLARLEGIDGVDVSFDPEDLNDMKQNFIEVAAERLVAKEVDRAKQTFEKAKTDPDSTMAQYVMKEMGFTEHPKVTLDKANTNLEAQKTKIAQAETLKNAEQVQLAADKLELAKLERSLYFTDEDDKPVQDEKVALKEGAKPVVAEEDDELVPEPEEAEVDPSADKARFALLGKEITKAFPDLSPVIKDGKELTLSLNDKLKTKISIKRDTIFISQEDGGQIYHLKAAELKADNFVKQALVYLREDLKAAQDIKLGVKQILAVTTEPRLQKPLEPREKAVSDYQETFKGLPFAVEFADAAVDPLKKIDFKITKGGQLEGYQLYDVSVKGKVDFQLAVAKDKPDSTVALEVHLGEKDTLKFVGYNADGTHDVIKFGGDKFIGMATGFKDLEKPKDGNDSTGPDYELEVAEASDKEQIDAVAAELVAPDEEFTNNEFLTKIDGLKNSVVAKGLEKAAKEFGEDVKQFAQDKLIDYSSLLQNPDEKFDRDSSVEKLTGLKYLVFGVGDERKAIFDKLSMKFSSNEIQKEGQKFALPTLDGKSLVVSGINMNNVGQIEVNSPTDLEVAKNDPTSFRWTLKVSFKDSDVVETLTFQGDKVVDYAGLGLTDEQGRLCGLTGSREQIDEKQDAALKAILDGKKFSQLKAFPNHIIAGYFDRANADYPQREAKKYGIDYAQLDVGKALFDLAQHKGLVQGGPMIASDTPVPGSTPQDVDTGSETVAIDVEKLIAQIPDKLDFLPPDGAPKSRTFRAGLIKMFVSYAAGPLRTALEIHDDFQSKGLERWAKDMISAKKYEIANGRVSVELSTDDKRKIVEIFLQDN